MVIFYILNHVKYAENTFTPAVINYIVVRTAKAITKGICRSDNIEL
ncbi:hypothetical protein HMPREF3293_01794 [Christensenella minuta]|uniref:Uncharacterized protein n=1 Tax=Christensenella minuta TaxID=626937 RepID=A0A136Q3F9_9FIRM|nr:hypothetical protein HMPREF3293_01794 [Christensenella minuta]